VIISVNKTHWEEGEYYALKIHISFSGP